jgi:hypothetical protein
VKREEMDEALVAMVDAAKIVARYYRALIDEGVPDSAAIQMAGRAGATLLTGGTSEAS